MKNNLSQEDDDKLRHVLASLTFKQKSSFLQRVEETAYTPTHIDENIQRRTILTKYFVIAIIKNIYISTLEYFHLVKHSPRLLMPYLMLVLGNLSIFLFVQSVQTQHYYNVASWCLILLGIFVIITKSHQRVHRSYLYTYLIITLFPILIAIFLPIYYPKSEVFLIAISAAALEYLTLLLVGSYLYAQQQKAG